MANNAELNLRDEVEDSYTGEDLPAQMGSPTPTIFPGIDLFQIPPNVDQCWDAKDVQRKDADGNLLANADGTPLVDQHLFLKFDRDSPLIVVGGPYDGLPATATISTMARNRARKGEEPRLVADLTYFVRDSLQDKTPVAKRKDWIAIVNKHAGHLVRLEHGLSAFCDPERVRYLSEDGTEDGRSVLDPTETHGCGMSDGKREGSRLYSQAFKSSEEELDANGNPTGRKITTWRESAVCKGCGAMLRGFFRVERFLKPLASAQVAR